MEYTKVQTINGNRIVRAKARFDYDVIEFKSFYDSKTIRKSSILDYAIIFYGFRKIVCIRYMTGNGIDTCCVATTVLNVITSRLDSWGIKISTPKDMRIAVPEDGGEKLKKISLGGIIAAGVLFFTFPIVAIVTDALFGGRVSEITAIV